MAEPGKGEDASDSLRDPPAARTRRKATATTFAAVAVLAVVLFLFFTRVALPALDSPGSQARDFASDRYPKLVVEVDWMVEGGTSYQPSAVVLSFLEQRLNERLTKPGGITVQLGNAIDASRSSYSVGDLRDVESQHRSSRTGGDTAAMWIVFATRSADAGSGGGQVIGVAYAGSACAVFASTIEDASGILVPRDTVEKITALHEVGHLLGLVNGGAPMVAPHEDAGHPRHSTNADSVMYWQVEGTDLISILSQGGLPDNFDANDMADLRGIGGK